MNKIELAKKIGKLAVLVVSYVTMNVVMEDEIKGSVKELMPKDANKKVKGFFQKKCPKAKTAPCK